MIPIEFLLFALTLAGVALFHRHTLVVALAGLALISLYKIGFTGFKEGAGVAGLGMHLLHEWVILANLLGLLLGFALLSNHFEKSKIPAVLPHWLPDDWKGAFVLLVMIFVLSSFSTTSPPRSSAAPSPQRYSAARCTSAISRPSSPRPMPAAPAAWLAIPPLP